jgi:crotonobetainyl-CoA:carnitine CoA-transferase CaiB-like acyl-CoA transferase
MPAVPVADMIGAWSAVTAILASLVERQRTGKGRWIDASLYDAGLHANLVGWAAEAGGKKGIGERLPLTGALPCYDLYETADGRRLALAALEPHFWKRLCRAVDRKDLVRRQYSASRKVRHQVKELIRGRTLAAWMEVLGREDVPAEPILSAAEARVHPQAVERSVVSAGPDGLLRVAFPARFDGERPGSDGIEGRVPELGEHTKALLAELGVPRHVETSPGVGRRFSFRRWLSTFLR